MPTNQRLPYSYYLLYGSLYGLSLLPFPLLYLLSDLVFLLLYSVIGYRKKVVLQNLRNAFPDKSEKEIRKIAWDFYRNLCDLFLEMFKTLSISEKSMLRHCQMSPEALALFRGLEAEGRSGILVMGHYGNWEWAGNTFSILCPQQLYVIYHPLSSPSFDRLMYKMRTRFGTGLMAMNNTFREMVKNRERVTLTAFICDQTPQPDRAFWTTFLNQDTPVFQGPETIARKLNYPIVYAAVHKIKRGYYQIEAELMVDHPAPTTEGAISEMHTRRLETDIVAGPSAWLWSHRRWKHKKPLSYTHPIQYPC
jgi:Kdo2-lipid IVA lauroyltransferase/acyltransferase